MCTHDLLAAKFDDRLKPFLVTSLALLNQHTWHAHPPVVLPTPYFFAHTSVWFLQVPSGM